MSDLIAKLKARYEMEKAKEGVRIFAVVLGTRGSGKSGTAAGTWGKNAKVLQLLFTTEDHGKDSALGVASTPDNILPVFVDVGDDGKRLTHDKTWDNLKAILTSDLSEFDVVVVDGLAALDVVVANHPKVLGAKGYDGKKISDLHFDELVTWLKGVSMSGKDVVLTCSTELRQNSEGLFNSPTLRGGSAINAVIGACSDVLLVDKIDTEQGTQFVFNFSGGDISKTGTKMSGDKYILAVNTRIAGIPLNEIPAVFPAKFSALKKLKADKLKR